MTEHLDDEPGQEHTASDAPGRRRVSRRGLFGAVAAGVGAYGLGRVTVGANPSVLGALVEPGSALESADRQPHPEPTPTTTTPAPTTTIPLAEGEILFPIVVGPDDDCLVLDNFGACRSGCSRSHEAVDIMADQGLPLQAVVSGVLTKKYVDSGKTFGAGNGWTLYDDENDVVYKYFHMETHADDLEVGDRVEQGQIIGTVGETGTSGAGNDSDNFHCHFEYRPGNVPRDAFHLLQRAPYVRFFGE
ncbi:MAG: M23 family metallopeptidase [Actinomycetota bacterium]